MKTKVSKENRPRAGGEASTLPFAIPLSGSLFTVKIYLIFPYLGQITNVSKKRIEQINFFNWLSVDKNIILSNGSEHLRNVIQWH